MGKLFSWNLISLLEVERTDGTSLKFVIKDTLVHSNRQWLWLTMQWSSEYGRYLNGVAAQIQRVEPKALVVCCLAHLCLQESGQKSLPIRDALALVIELHNLIHLSPKHLALFTELKPESYLHTILLSSFSVQQGGLSELQQLMLFWKITCCCFRNWNLRQSMKRSMENKHQKQLAWLCQWKKLNCLSSIVCLVLCSSFLSTKTATKGVHGIWYFMLSITHKLLPDAVYRCSQEVKHTADIIYVTLRVLWTCLWLSSKLIVVTLNTMNRINPM